MWKEAEVLRICAAGLRITQIRKDMGVETEVAEGRRLGQGALRGLAPAEGAAEAWYSGLERGGDFPLYNFIEF